ncbi:cyclase family protein [Jatrophihabitans sp.]|jgi:kynurenine formamidase|uniref:cyclase family protein n=1 Tax=Jatrophihabitans sp. TaxID=1932789 RepID=UPI002F1E55C0
MPAQPYRAEQYRAEQYRAEFDATVVFGNGGSLRAERFRVDVPGPDTTAEQVGELFLASLSLLMVQRVEVRDLRLFAEAHKGTRGGPSDSSGAPAPAAAGRRWVELSHVITAGMVTYPGIPAPEITPQLTREASRQVYAPGTEFAMDRISMIGNTGTYLDSPYHRYAGGTDLAGLPLTVLADLPVVLVRTTGSTGRAVDVGALAALHVRDHAVLLHTGGDRRWGTPAYAEDAPYLTEAGARWLVEHGARLVGIDSVNIDDISSGGHRPAHSVLLAAGVPIVEHLTGLDQLPPTGARFTAAPPRVARFGTFPVRAYASVPVDAAQPGQGVSREDAGNPSA